ncbi:hypothetical protein LDENG_00050910 [Lucifuga dentata]|nr:hypothetical protein LDENG_00050910 [Lucifuga dentata]
MGNFSTKDSHEPTVAHVDTFHTPPTTPLSDAAGFMPSGQQLPSSPQLPPAVPASSPAVPLLTSSGKKHPSNTPTTPSPPPEWSPHLHPPVRSNSSTTTPGIIPAEKKSGSTTAAKGLFALGRNGGPPSSTPRTPVSSGKSVAISPTRSLSSLRSASPVATNSSGQSRGERDSGLSCPLLPIHEADDSQGKELEKLLEECRTALGVTANQDGGMNTAEILKRLLTEVESLRSTLQMERGEWSQFQADLQVAVAVADRLRAEAEEELTALRTAHKDVERELAASQQRQKEADMQLVTLRGELKESRQKLAALTQAQDKSDTQAPSQAPERPDAETNNSDSQEGTRRGWGRGVYRLGREAMESESRNEGMKNIITEEARTDSKGVTKRYLRNVTNEDRSGEEVRSGETRRAATTERSRSLSRLPMSSEPLTMQNGTSQSNTAITSESTNKNTGPVRGRRSLEDSKPNADTGKREETLNKYNSTLTELPPTKSQDGFNLLLRRHGGSKRNSLLRWCQSRTQGYKNIDITNFSSSWADGLAFCAVYHTYLPSHIPYCTLSPESKKENLSLAFKTGETVGIAQSLTVEEMLRAGGPDWQRVLSYVESMYRHFEITLYLISGPDELHAATPTPLAVTILADSPVTVTAELAHGDTKVTQSKDFQGGLTGVLTLPPIPGGSIPQNSSVTLTVSGHQTGNLIFTNTTTINFDLRNVFTFIQTDRFHYQPGDTVRVRIVSVQLDNHPYKGRVDISIQDAMGNIVHMLDSTSSLGIVLTEFVLSETSLLGQWAVTVTVNGITDKKEFTVEDYEPPHFEMLVKTASRVLVGDDISGSVRAFYIGGLPVKGTLAVSVNLLSALSSSGDPFNLTQTKEIHGSARFFFSRDQLQALYTSSGTSNDGRDVAHITTSITDTTTGFKVKKTVEVHLLKDAFHLEFYDFPHTLKPSLFFSATLRISRYDRQPLNPFDLLSSAVLEVTQRTSNIDAEPTIQKLPVPEDGNVHIKFKLQDDVVMLFIHAKFKSSEQTLELYNNYSSPSGSYIQISPITSLPAQIGLPLQIAVESTFQPAELHYVVSSTCQILAAGTETASSFSLTPTLSWSPEAYVTVYCVLSGGEVTSDTVHIPIHQHNNVSLKWNTSKAEPGDQVSFTVTVVESQSQVGILVIGADDDPLEVEQDLKVEKECNIRMLTNARLHMKKLPDGPNKGHSEGDTLIVERYWRHWVDQDATESWLWLDANVSDTTWTSMAVTVPDRIISWRAVALVMSENLGLGFTTVPQQLTVSKDLSLSLDVPSFLIRGEEIVLEVKIFNHLERDIEVIVLVEQSDAYAFVLAEKGDISVVNAQKHTAGSHEVTSALFPIRPLTLGEMEISVDVISTEAFASLVQILFVKPEGVEQVFSETLFLELTRGKDNNSTVSFSFPPDVVPGSQRAHVAVVGDILALSINNLDSLVQVPSGCGEQNMIHFAPSIYVLKYLNMLPKEYKELKARALGHMRAGYQRQLSYLRDDGSFGACGASDTSGSIWLTAFVVRCFLQAQPFIQVDQGVLTRAVGWLLDHQSPRGEFTEVGRPIHSEMQGGIDDGAVKLTAYVLTALLESEAYAVVYQGSVSLARRYLEDKVFRGGLSTYSLCLVAYALTMANSPVAGTALFELNNRDETKMWTSSAGLDSDDLQPSSVHIEMASYVLLAFFRSGNVVEGFPIMKWLSKQRNYQGGFRTTQDTIVALQCLADFAVFSGASAINLRLHMSVPPSSSVTNFSINSSNFLMYQSKEINADKDLLINLYMEGRGFSLFQMNVFYNVESRALSKEITDKEAFSLNVDVADNDHDHMLLSICIRLKDSQVISRTGMCILDVGILSGFTLSPGAAAPTDLIRKVERSPGKVILYLDSLTKSEVCIRLPLFREYKVARVQHAVIKVYDFYDTARRAMRTYNSDILHKMDSCFFCGVECHRCSLGMSFTASSILSSYSMSGATYSLSCLLAAVTAFLSVAN